MSRPSPVRTLPQISFGSEAIALHSIREMRPWSFDAATLKSEPVQPVPSVIINRTARRYRGSFLQILSHQSPVSQPFNDEVTSHQKMQNR